MTLQRQGFPNARIHMFKNYDAWEDNEYTDWSGALVVLTLRDGMLSGINEGLLQVMDTGTRHMKLTGDEFVVITVTTANTVKTYERVYAIQHNSTVVDKKGDSVITFQLRPLHYARDQKFSRAFGNNAQDSIQQMFDYLYRDASAFKPVINSDNIRVPTTNWTKQLKDYCLFCRRFGFTISESPVYVWEDMFGFNMRGFDSILLGDPEIMLLIEPTIVGQMSNESPYRVVFDFEWLTQTNRGDKSKYEHATFYAYSMLDKNMTFYHEGDGTNSVGIDRSGGYADQVYRDGREERTRIDTLSEYQSYCKMTTYGDFGVVPGQRHIVHDAKNQFKQSFIIDEVIHEITREQSMTTIYSMAKL